MFSCANANTTVEWVRVENRRFQLIRLHSVPESQKNWFHCRPLRCVCRDTNCDLTFAPPPDTCPIHGRLHIGTNRVSWLPTPGKNGWKIKLVGQADDDYYRYYYWSLPFFVSIPLQILKIFFASGGKGALTPLTTILRTSLATSPDNNHRGQLPPGLC